MTSANRPKPLFTLRTDELAGRHQELRKLQNALAKLQQTADRTLLFYIAGDGGLGKTRLLQWVKQQALPANVFCTNILDLYNSILRTDVDLVEQIYDDIEEQLNRLPKRLNESFTLYKQLRERYHRQDTGATGGQFREKVIDAFFTGWLPLVKAGYRLIVLLDTAELLRFEDDTIRKNFERFGAKEPTASAKRWLEEVVNDDADLVDEKLPGVLFVVAGRKEEAKELYASFCNLADQHTTTAGERIVDLGGLTVDGIEEYLRALATKLDQAGFTTQAAQLREDIDPALRQALFYLTNGSPIALAMALQIYIDQPSKELESLIDEQIQSPTQAVPEAERRLQKALVKTLAEQQMFGDTSTAIRYMALARKGLTARRLRNLLPAQSNIDFEAIFANLRELIFIKQRPDGSLVLHDKVADWTEEGLYGVDEVRSRLVYEKMVDLYDQEIAELDRRIDQLAAKADPVESDDEDLPDSSLPADQQSDPFAHENSQEFRRARRTRRNLLVERMTYALRANPVLGYKHYFELAEEAFNVGRMDYESQIRAEFLGWWDYREPANSGKYRYRHDAYTKGLPEELIQSDFAIRTVQREYNRESPELSPSERMQNTVELVNSILTEVRAGRFPIPPFAQILLSVYADTASGQLAESDDDIGRVRQSFQTHIAQLQDLLEQNRNTFVQADEEAPLPLPTFLTLNALAFAQYEFAFFESNHGNHGSAIESYTRSLLPYRELGFEINQARSLNDKAYSLAMMGDSDSAETAVEDAIRLRKRLGFSYLTALSYNTLGIVRTMAERPITAIRYCDYALRTFRGLNHEFGQMIAGRALSEAYRRSAEYSQRDRPRQLRALEQALAASRAATALATDLLTETDLLLAEVLDECGCAYRDLAHFRWQNPELYKDQYQNAHQESERLIKAAITTAEKLPSARTYLVDSMINLAFLSFYQIARDELDKVEKRTILDETQQLAMAALEVVPIHYRNPQDPQHTPADLTVYWAYLAKAYSLLVRTAHARLTLVERTPENRARRESIENELLREAIYTLYFRSLLKGNVRNVRRSHLAVYESFQAFTVFTLNRLYKLARPVSQELGIPDGTIVEFLKKDFGL